MRPLPPLISALLKKKKSVGGPKAKPPEESDFQRLPHHIVPKNYIICIKPNLELFYFEGCVSVHVEIIKEAKMIFLHAIDLNISKIMWEEDVTENRQEPFEYFLDAPREQLRVVFVPPLSPGFGCIRINFNGNMNKKPIGLYHSKYIGTNGEELPNGVTKFDSTEARRCFPCWDEPTWKATFDMSFILPRTLTAITNMPFKVSYPHRTREELHVVEFMRTPVMAPFMLAFTMGEFSFVETIWEKSPIRVYTPLGMEDHGQFALKVCSQVLPYFQRVFNVPYSLGKFDMVGVTDLNTTAIGSWGLMIFRATRFLIKESETTAHLRQIIARNIAHEIARQWMGNLVSLDWWSHLWLYESYATFMEYTSISSLFPEYDVWTQFLSDIYGQGLKLDACKCSHAIDFHVHNPAELRDGFDIVAFCKSASLMRMLNHYIGESVFLQGMQKFFKKYSNRNAGPEKLWRILEKLSEKPIVKLMQTWSQQIGYPLLRVTSTKYDTSQRSITITIVQEKFRFDHAMRDKTGSKDLWMIPLSMSIASSPHKVAKEILMDKKAATVVIHNVNKPQWVKLNPGSFGFYRVKYTTEALGHFLRSVRNKTMPPLDRYGLLSDLLAMIESGLSPSNEIFSLLEAFVDEDNYLVWTQIDKVMESLDSLLFETPCYHSLHTFCRVILTNVFELVGWDHQHQESPAMTKLRSLVLNRLLRLNQDDVLQEGTIRCNLMADGTQTYPSEIRAILYKITLMNGSGETLRQFFKMYRETDSLEEKERIAQAMGEVKEHDHLQDALGFAISEDIKMHDSLVIFKAVGMRKPGIDVAWEFLKDHWSFLRNKYPPGAFSSELIQSTTSNFTKEENAVEIETFFKEHLFPGSERAIQQSLEKIRMMDAWLKRDIQHIADYLASF